MKTVKSETEELRHFIAEIDKMSRRGFMKGVASTAASAAMNPNIGSVLNPGSVDDTSWKRLAKYVMSFAKARAEDNANHPATTDLINFSKKIVNKLQNGWQPDALDLAKIKAKQEMTLDEIFDFRGAEDPNHDFDYDLKGIFGFDADKMDQISDLAFRVGEKFRQVARASTAKIKVKVPKRPEVTQITDNLREQLKSTGNIQETFESMPDDLRKAVEDHLKYNKNNDDELTPEQLDIILSKMNKSMGEQRAWFYQEKDEYYEKVPEISDYLNSMFDEEPEQEPVADEPETSADDSDSDTSRDPTASPEDPKNQKQSTASESIRYYINVLEKINKK